MEDLKDQLLKRKSNEEGKKKEESSDQQSAQMVKQAIKDDQGLSEVAKDIHVTVKDGTVTLKGEVATEQQLNLATPFGGLTENGKFYKAAEAYKAKKSDVELVKVYEKIRDGIWTYSGIFKLIDAWEQSENKRKVFKFKLEITDDSDAKSGKPSELEHTRLIGAMLFLVEILQDSPRFLSSRMSYMQRSQAASTNETSSILTPLTLGSFSNRLAIFS